MYKIVPFLIGFCLCVAFLPSSSLNLILLIFVTVGIVGYDFFFRNPKIRITYHESRRTERNSSSQSDSRACTAIGAVSGNNTGSTCDCPACRSLKYTESGQALKAYRVWWCKDGVLYPTSHMFRVWKPGQKMVCHTGEPTFHLTQEGVYGAKLGYLDYFINQIINYRANFIYEYLNDVVNQSTITSQYYDFMLLNNVHLVVGSVWLWGKVIVHERAYRAQFGYPDKIWTYPNKTVAQEVARNYGCEVVDALLDEFYESSFSYGIPRVFRPNEF